MTKEEISFLALCLNSLPGDLGLGTLFTFYSHKGKSRCLHKQNNHLPWVYAVSNSKKQKVLILIFL